MKVFLLAVALVGLCVFGMCFNIIFRKDGEFPEYEVSKNKDMRRLGIRCVHEEEALARAKKRGAVPGHCSGKIDEACSGCALYASDPCHPERSEESES